ncbi:N-acetylmuramoyl-L-alanine amidase [Alteromonas sp. H39]|uniref:N-acetylmuramoyl-L-alanine amidase n=1 Tax=Alteromonas sp. H39 TaxID=3389876 RepID=UPI0039E16C60
MFSFDIKANRLQGESVTFEPSPNHSGEFPSGAPDTIVIHFTAGSSLSSSVSVMTNPANKVSAHICIGRQGEVVQMVPFNHIAWHAGRSEWQGREQLNRFSIGIELDNAGELTPNGNGAYLSWFNNAYSGDDVFRGVHRNQHSTSYWHAYTEAQIQATFSLCQVLCQHYPINTIVGHEEIAPGRKIDPGPAFPLDKLRHRLLGIDPVSLPVAEVQTPAIATEAIVTSTSLNVRAGPGTHHEKVAEPLTKGTPVTVVKQRNGWAQVRFETTGWVSTRYLQKLD